MKQIAIKTARVIRRSIMGLLLVVLPTHSVSANDSVSNWDQVSALVQEYSWVGTVAGAGLSYLSAKKHDAMLAAYFEKVLRALDEINTKLDILKTTTCNIYQHRTNQDYATFQRQLLDYLNSADRSVFFDMLYALQNDATAIITALEDHTNLLANCALDQYEFLAIYMTMANIDLSIQAEYIRQSYYITFRMQGNGTLIPLAQMDPQSRATMEALIATDIKTKLSLRMARIVSHLKVLDGVSESGGASPFTWRKRSDERFSSLSSTQDIHRTVGRNASTTVIRKLNRYTYNGQYYQYAWYDSNFASLYGVCCESRGRVVRTLPKFTIGNNLWITIPKPEHSPDECLYRKQRSFRITRVVTPVAGACNHYTKRPGLVSIFDNYAPQTFNGDFAFLNSLGRFSYLFTTLIQPSIYNRHKSDKYKELVNSELVPIVALANQWRDEINLIDAPNVADVPPLPSFTAITETR